MVETLDPDLSAPKTPSIDPDEVAKFTAMADEWWDPAGNSNHCINLTLCVCAIFATRRSDILASNQM